MRMIDLQRARRRRKRKTTFKKIKSTIFVLIAVLFGTLALFDFGPGPDTKAISNGPVSTSGLRVVDGDTVKLSSGASIRLVGFNTPETYKPRCDRELQLGKQATARLKALVRGANSLDLDLVRCACKPGTEGTEACNFGRACGKLFVDGRDVGDTLISEGLAVRFDCGPNSCPKMPRPWC